MRIIYRMVDIGSIFNGVAASITMAGPPLLSVIWFPVHERTTATALAAGASYLGTGVSFLSGEENILVDLSAGSCYIV